MVALSDSQTGAVACDHVRVEPANILAGPIPNVLANNGGGAGGLQTSILALGLAKSAIDFVEKEAINRTDLSQTQTELRTQLDQLCQQLFLAADKNPKDLAIAAEVRSQANSLALRATQAALVIAKGAGFVEGHPVGRWCSEALFFLVWSCPQDVAQANLGEFVTCSLQ